MPQIKNSLTDRQRRFAEAYFEYGNALKAAEVAGFAPQYASTVKRNPAVQAYLQELAKQHVTHREEVINFLTGVMRGTLKASQLRTEAAYQMGKRAGLWKSHKQYESMIKEAIKHE